MIGRPVPLLPCTTRWRAVLLRCAPEDAEPGLLLLMLPLCI
jgi:hypothetical protein